MYNAPIAPWKDGSYGGADRFIRNQISTSNAAFRCEQEYIRKLKEEKEKRENAAKSCCYVTTACLDALGKPRDSPEMSAMKTLTKNYVLKSFSGKRDYIMYRRRGPAIAEAINSREDSQGIWKNVYERLGDVTSSVLSSNYEMGHRLYKDLMLGLEKQFVKN